MYQPTADTCDPGPGLAALSLNIFILVMRIPTFCATPFGLSSRCGFTQSMAGKRTAPAAFAKDEPATTRAKLGSPPTAFRICSYNVNSLRSMLKSDALTNLVTDEQPDILCIQETKMTPEAVKQLPDPTSVLPGYNVRWNHSTTAKGKHGTCIFTRKGVGIKVVGMKDGIGEEESDGEGRTQTMTIKSDVFGSVCVVNCYVPNSGAKLARLGYRTETFEPAMREYLAALRKKMADSGGVVCYTGDLNCAHEEIDIHNSKGNVKNAGHTPEERAAFTELLKDEGGFVDVFRRRNPDVKDSYTFWSMRSKTTRAQNKGWRLDYFLINKEAMPRVSDMAHLTNYTASDHSPIMLTLAPLKQS